MANQLASETSLYLRQHAENPVAWRPWGAPAFAEARETGKPVLLSIGYSACHWCHVMAHESFEDEATATLMNRLFVNIKVDREERPDVDHVYMSALHSLGQQGGWPLTMFLSPDGKPFWGGTYFPKTARYGQPAFASVLRSVAEAYHTRPGDIAGNGEAILAALRQTAVTSAAAALSSEFATTVARRIQELFDPVNGGMKGAPKFPNPPVLELLWRAADRTGDESIRGAVLTTLERMCRGGIFDHVGGGFARYSVDERWLAPHFEKMLYDNAQLLPLLALAAQRTGGALFHSAAERTAAWLLRDMTTDSGAFAASLDADSLNDSGHAHEGAYYLWTPQQIERVLGPEAPAFMAAFDVTPPGNFEGESILNQLHRSGPADPEFTRWAPHLARLQQLRALRPPPGRDDKVLADWNGLMIAGLARAGALLGQMDWVAAAQRAFAAVVDHLGAESDAGDAPPLGHSWREGRSLRPGFAADHAAMALAALALAEATGRVDYVTLAEGWCGALLTHYLTEAGVLAMTAAGSADLPLRPSPTQDDAVPNANALACEAFIRLATMTQNADWLARADDLIAALTPAIRANPYGHAATLNALDLRLRQVEITLAAKRDDPLARIARSVPYPNRILVWQAPGAPPSATVCAQGHCSLPLTDPEQLRARIEKELTSAPG